VRRRRRGNEQPGLTVHDQVGNAADRGRDDRTSVRHRLDDAEWQPLAVRGQDDDGGARVEPVQLGMRQEPERVRDERAQRPVTGDDEVQPAGRLDQLANTLLRREPPGVEDFRRLDLAADLDGDLDAVRDHAHVLGAAASSGCRERFRDADHDAGAAEDEADEPRRTARQLEVGESAGRAGALQGDDEGPARERGDEPGGEPMRVHEIGALRRAAKRPEHREEHQGRHPRPAAQVVDDAAAVREAVVAVHAGREHLDLDAVALEAAHHVRDEAAGVVLGMARIGRGQMDDLHVLSIGVRPARLDPRTPAQRIGQSAYRPSSYSFGRQSSRPTRRRSSRSQSAGSGKSPVLRYRFHSSTRS
jgi:hypothetical protein